MGLSPKFQKIRGRVFGLQDEYFEGKISKEYLDGKRDYLYKLVDKMTKEEKIRKKQLRERSK